MTFKFQGITIETPDGFDVEVEGDTVRLRHARPVFDRAEYLHWYNSGLASTYVRPAETQWTPTLPQTTC